MCLEWSIKDDERGWGCHGNIWDTEWLAQIVKLAVMRLGVFLIGGQGDLLIRFIPWNIF